MSRLVLPVSARDHTWGRDDAPVTLVEYGDYEHAACVHAYYVIREIQEDMGGSLRFIFRNFPVTADKPRALRSALAAEASSIQEAFWEMHDALFEHPKQHRPRHLLALALDFDLRIGKFVNDIASSELAYRVQADFLSGIQSGVVNAPALFINNQLYNGAVAYEPLRATLEDAAHSAAIQINPTTVRFYT